jgi:hypothetical protein
MAPSSLASATHDRSLGLSASTLHYSHLRELWHPTLVPPFHETPRSDVDFSPLVLATSRLRKSQCRAPMPLSHEFPEIASYFILRPTTQLSPFTTAACGTFMRVPILSPVSSTHWHVVRIHVSMSNPSMESNSQIPSSDQRRRSFRCFGVSTMESPDPLF